MLMLLLLLLLLGMLSELWCTFLLLSAEMCMGRLRS